jgi:hypothetical protein
MNEDLQSMLDRLRDTPYFKSKPEVSCELLAINKYADSEEERAYLLGCLFTNPTITGELPSEYKNPVIACIKSQNLHDYYYLKNKPERQSLEGLSVVFLIGGTAAIALGIIQVFNGTLTVGVNLRYLTFVVQNGGYKVLLGLILLVGGFVRYNHERRKRLLYDRLKPMYPRKG